MSRSVHASGCGVPVYALVPLRADHPKVARRSEVSQHLFPNVHFFYDVFSVRVE